MRAMQRVVILLLVLAAGCGRGGAEDEADAPAGGGRFGDPYQVVPGFHPAEPDTPPALAGDTLVALVTYTGGCEDHDFALDYAASADTARVWIRHDAHGDACEALIEDEVRLPLPREALAPPVVVLLNPQDPIPFILRWGR